MVVVATGTRDVRDNKTGQTVFAFTNWTEDAGVDCNSATNDELSDTLATVVKILIEQGILNGTVASA